MLQAIVVDDSPVSLRATASALEATGEVQIAGMYCSAADALAALPHLSPDVAFLDIEMPDTSGIQLAREIVGLAGDIGIVFVTAHKEYALDAFGVCAVDYLTKPLDRERLLESIRRLQKNHRLASPAPGEATCRILCLGEFAVYPPGTAIPLHWRTKKTQELFAYLVQHLGRSLAKWQILDDLWVEKAPEKRECLLHTTLYYLKRNLREAGVDYQLQQHNSCYRLTLPGAYLDFRHFEALSLRRDGSLAAPSTGDLQSALALYQGDYLASLDYLWSLPLQQKLAQAQQQLARTLARRGR